MIKAGAFDSLGHTRKGLIQVYEQSVDAVVGTKRAEAVGQFDLFSFGTDEVDPAGAAPMSSRSGCRTASGTSPCC